MHRPGIIGGRPHHGGGGYVGPLDIVPGAVVAWSAAWALSSAMRGQPIFTIADGAGGATQSFNTNPATGEAPVAAVQSYSSTPFVALTNDQSGSGNDVAQAVGANQPSWVASAVGSKPSFLFDHSRHTKLFTSAPVSFTGDMTFFAVLQTPDVSFIQEIMGAGWQQSGNGGWQLSIRADGDPASVWHFLDDDAVGNGPTYKSTGGIIATDTAIILSGTLNAATPDGTGVVNGVSSPNTSGGGTLGFVADGGLTFPIAFGAADSIGGTANLGGYLSEALVYFSVLSGANQLAITQNIAARYP